MTSSPEVGPSPASSARRPYIDWARGIAVLIMIGAHILDAWTAPAARTGRAFTLLNLISGYAAPLFLWLAGLSVVLAADRAVARGEDRRTVAIRLMRRGGVVFLLAFLFRLQAFVVSPGNPLLSLLRVDILNIMGPSMMGAAFLWGIAGNAGTVAVLNGAAAAAIALATPVVRSAASVTLLPAVLQWYVTPAGNHSTFTLFPWAGFVFAGAAVAALLGLAAPSREQPAVRRLGIAGVVLVALGFYLSTRPSIYAASSFWTSSPTYFAIRVGILMLVAAGLYAARGIAGRIPAPFAVLEQFGRHSLFVYWIHVELVYGYATFPIHRRLPLWGTGLGFLLFSAAMYGAIALELAVVQAWRTRRLGHGVRPRGLTPNPAQET